MLNMVPQQGNDELKCGSVGIPMFTGLPTIQPQVKLFTSSGSPKLFEMECATAVF